MAVEESESTVRMYKADEWFGRQVFRVELHPRNPAVARLLRGDTRGFPARAVFHGRPQRNKVNCRVFLYGFLRVSGVLWRRLLVDAGRPAGSRTDASSVSALPEKVDSR